MTLCGGCTLSMRLSRPCDHAFLFRAILCFTFESFCKHPGFAIGAHVLHCSSYTMSSSALGDGSSDEDEVDDVLPLVPMPSPLLPRPIFDRRPRTLHRGTGYPRMRVRYDNYSNQSGHLRVYCVCPTNHVDCFKFQFLRYFDTPNHCMAWLYAWACLGKPIDEQSGAVHRAVRPSDEEVKRELFPG